VEQRLAVVEDILLTIARDVGCSCGLGGEVGHWVGCPMREPLRRAVSIAMRSLGRKGLLDSMGLDAQRAHADIMADEELRKGRPF
jgi:hypothetical protein